MRQESTRVPPGDQPQISRATVPSNGGHQPENWTGTPYFFNLEQYFCLCIVVEGDLSEVAHAVGCTSPGPAVFQLFLSFLFLHVPFSTDADLASHRVRLWRGGSASTRRRRSRVRGQTVKSHFRSVRSSVRLVLLLLVGGRGSRRGTLALGYVVHSPLHAPRTLSEVVVQNAVRRPSVRLRSDDIAARAEDLKTVILVLLIRHGLLVLHMLVFTCLSGCHVCLVCCWPVLSPSSTARFHNGHRGNDFGDYVLLLVSSGMVLQLCSVSEYLFHKCVRLVKSVQSMNHLVCLESIVGT